jgi:hypothetical protein
MIKELKYVFYIIIIFFFIFFVSRYYFSDEYNKKSYRSLNMIEEKINIFSENLVTLESDTNDIRLYVEYKKEKNKKKIPFLGIKEKRLIKEGASLLGLKVSN